MSNQPFVQSGQAAGPPNEAEYNAVYAAVTATERGRWFLAEYANRNRSADTELVMAAVARIEAAINAGAVPQSAATGLRDVTLLAAPIAVARADVGERDDDAVPSVRYAPPPGGIADVEAQKDRDYSEAVAAIAASLTARFGELAERAPQDLTVDLPAGLPEGLPVHLPVDAPRDPEREFRTVEVGSKGATENAMESALSEVATPQQRVPQDNAPRWHIEAPDFVFGEGDGDDSNGGAKPAGESALLHSQLLGAAILSEDDDEAADSLEALPPAAIAVPIELSMELAPAAPTKPPAAETPIPSFSPPEIVPFVEIARPQLRIANDPVPVNQHPRRYDSPTITDALSEDEVIALFG